MNDHNKLEQTVDLEMEGLLDEALVAEPAPPGLAERVVAATRTRLPPADPVVGRIGFSPMWYPIAAAVAVAAMAWAAVWFAAPAPPSAPGHGSRTQVADAGIEEVDWVGGVEDELDRELTALETELALETDSVDWDGQWVEEWDDEGWDDFMAVDEGALWESQGVY